MSRLFPTLLAAILAAAPLVPVTAASARAEAPESATQSALVLGWEELMPPGEEERLMEIFQQFIETRGGLDSIAEGSSADTMVQLGTFNVVPDLDGKKVRIPGYIVPLDLNAKTEVKEFLLVPYFGACIHVPPPPPNQIVYVSAPQVAKVANLWDPVWVEGTLKTQQHMNNLGNAAYTLTLDKVEAYK